MRLLIFDTETTGLPKTRDFPTKENVETFPEIVQISWLTYDTTTQKLQEFDYILKVKDIPIESTEIHGITASLSRVSGFPFEKIIDIFQVCIDASDLLIAHNLEFDWKIIIAECIRRNIMVTCTIPTYCTMKSSTKLCNLPRMKWPTLKELHFFLFKEDPHNLHNAMIDVLVCFRSYMKIMYNEDICLTHKSLRKRF